MRKVVRSVHRTISKQRITVTTFCPLPWIFQAVRNNGDLRVCCQSNVSSSRGLLTDGNGTTLNALNTTSEKARNAPELKHIRQTMLAGEWPETCIRCRREEDAGLRSRRIYENEIWGREFDENRARTVTKNDGSISTDQVPLRSLDIRFGNKCNLACRMCGPTDSDFWYGDHAELYGPKFLDTQGEVGLIQDHNGRWSATDKGYLWYNEASEFWNSLEERLRSLRHIHIVGGEPLLIQRHYEFLEKLVESGASSQIQIEYNTNLTVLPEKALELWRNFKSVRIGVSIDGTGSVNEYIRYPSKWPVIERHLKRLNAFGSPISYWLSMSVQIYNIFHIPTFISWRLNSGLDRLDQRKNRPLVTSHAVHSPDFLSLQALPFDLKVAARDRLQSSLSEFQSKNLPGHFVEDYKKIVTGYVDFMFKKDLSASFDQFIRYTKSLDRQRKQNFIDLFPEFKSYF